MSDDEVIASDVHPAILVHIKHLNSSFSLSLFRRYWPEFGAEGKENVTLLDLLSHQAGMASFDRPITEDDVKVSAY